MKSDDLGCAGSASFSTCGEEVVSSVAESVVVPDPQPVKETQIRNPVSAELTLPNIPPYFDFRLISPTLESLASRNSMRASASITCSRLPFAVLGESL